MTRIVPAFTISSRFGSELIAELRAREALSYRSAISVSSEHVVSGYILDQLLSIGVVREGAVEGTYYLDEESLAPLKQQARNIRFLGYAALAIVLASLIGVALLNLLE